MRNENRLLTTLLLVLMAYALNGQTEQPLVNSETVIEEENGMLVVEAEHFYRQTLNGSRSWHRHSKVDQPKVWSDADGTHLAGASGNAYLEVLPDTRTTHGDELIAGLNFSNRPGLLAVVHYKVYINNPGRYYVWVRAYSTGTEDNGVHVGLDGEWPESGQRMQWCEGKNAWTWGSKQRTAEVHCGVPHQIYLDIEKAGIHEIAFSMREDGFELDRFLLTTDRDFKPEEANITPSEPLHSVTLPPALPAVDQDRPVQPDIYNAVLALGQGIKLMRAIHFPIQQTSFYKDRQWLAIDPQKAKRETTVNAFPFATGSYDLVFLGVGENDGQSSYEVKVNGKAIGQFTAPLSEYSFEEGIKYIDLWENISVGKGDQISVRSEVGSKDGEEFSRARWGGIAFTPVGSGKELLAHLKDFSTRRNVGQAMNAEPAVAIGKTYQVVEKRDFGLVFSDPNQRKADGQGTVTVSGELKRWHKVTLDMEGPFAHELDATPNPFTDYRMTVVFTHESGSPSYTVPGYFAADGNAGQSSADQGRIWRAHLSPDKIGTWHYKVEFLQGEYVALTDVPWSELRAPYHGIKGSFEIAETDKGGRDFRSKGRLEYNGKHYLQFKGSGEYFFKAGTDAPETLLAYEDFDGTYTLKTPLKTWNKHARDWRDNDPTWQGEKGKGLIGALNYLAEKGVNAISFLTYNSGGDGYNVWPFIKHDEKYRYDCSKLDQWQLVFDHAQQRGLHLHFKLQETENDDHKSGEKVRVVESLDGGQLGPQRRLYLREMIARYGYALALNWNLGEENTQSIRQRRSMAKYISDLCPYPQNIVIHTFPNQQGEVYPSLLGDQSKITGASLQNSWNQVHRKTLQWIKASDLVGKPWVVANDEQGSASQGVPPDPGYDGYDVNTISYDIHDIRKQTLWANLMAGGAGVEYYFGYKLPENDLLCEDFRSRDQSWNYCSIAIDFFNKSGLPFWEMQNRNDLIGNATNDKEKFCLAATGNVYLVYLAYARSTSIDLQDVQGNFSINWFNPRNGEKGLAGSVTNIEGGGIRHLGDPPSDAEEDWLAIIVKN